MVIFTVSQKLLKSKKVFIFLAVIIIFITALLFVIFYDDPYTAEFDNKSYSLRVKTKKDISEFVAFFGLKIIDDPIYVNNITIPSNFNDIYLKYNDLQKEIGLDLEKYKGQDCTLYSYEIIFPERYKGNILNLIIQGDKVIGCDISQKEYNGKMFSLRNNI